MLPSEVARGRLVNRSLAGFIVFLVVLLIAAGIGAWLLGPNLVGLALDDERRGAPYYLLNFAAGEQVYEYGKAFAELAAGDEGRLAWQATTLRVVDGRLHEQWRAVQLHEFPRGSDFVEMLTGSGYREVVASHPRVSHMMLGTGTVPQGLHAGQLVVLDLLEIDAQGANVEAAMARLVAAHGAFQGEVIWDVEVADPEAEWPWNRLLVLQFPNEDRARRWLLDPVAVTERALAAADVGRRVTLIVRSAGN